MRLWAEDGGCFTHRRGSETHGDGVVSCRREGFTIEGENNGHPDRSKRDSAGKYVLGTLVRS